MATTRVDAADEIQGILPVANGGTGVATITGVVKGSGASAFSAATAGTDYVAPGGALGTPSSGTLTNCTGLPVSGITASTSTALGVGTVELGHATDTTLSRSAAGVLQVEGVPVMLFGSGSTTSSATPTINTGICHSYTYGLTAQTAAITSFTTNLTGTPADGYKLWIYVVGTAARAITWGAKFEDGAVTLPTTTVTTQRLDVGFVWNAVSSKWRCMASGSAA